MSSSKGNSSVILIIIFIVFFIFILLIIFIIIIVGGTTTDNTTTSGNFNIYNKQTSFLKNLKSLSIKNTQYFEKSNSVGIKFLKPGRYNFNINFNMTYENDKGDRAGNVSGNAVELYMFISDTSSDIKIYSWSEVAKNVRGPTYLELNAFSFCPANIAEVNIHRSLQKTASSDPNLGGNGCPLIVLEYHSHSTDTADITDSNYYGMSGIIYISEENLNITYYIQSAFYSDYPGKSTIPVVGPVIKQSDVRIMKGSGNLEINFLG